MYLSNLVEVDFQLQSETQNATNQKASELYGNIGGGEEDAGSQEIQTDSIYCDFDPLFSFLDQPENVAGSN